MIHHKHRWMERKKDTHTYIYIHTERGRQTQKIQTYKKQPYKQEKRILL